MAAPEVSAFGDGDHDPGATGLTVDGGGFGAFPGSVWIYENDDLTGNADELDVNSWNDLQLNVDIPGSLTNTAGTRYLFVQREDLAWSNAFAFTLASSLTVQEAAHSHTADNVALTQANVLAIADAGHLHAVESPALTQQNVLAVQEAAHGHGAESPSLTQAGTLVVADSGHAHAVDSPILLIPGAPRSPRVFVAERPKRIVAA